MGGEATKENLVSSLSDIGFGSVAGMVGKLVEYPFDTVKVRLQSQTSSGIHFSGPLDCFRQTLVHEGFRGLYRGLASPLVGAAAENASLFLSYNLAKKATLALWFTKGNDEKDIPLGGLVGCGAISGAFTSFVLTPIELVKCQMQVQKLSTYGSSGGGGGGGGTDSLGPLQLCRRIYQKDGLGGFWRGQLGTLLRETGGSAAWFGSYEYVSKFLVSRRGHSSLDDPTKVESMIAGACAGMAYNLSLFPADSVKSRMQTDAVLSNNNNSNHNGSFVKVATAIYRESGIKGLYRGCGITVARAAPSSALIFVTYQQLKEWGQGFTNEGVIDSSLLKVEL